MIINAGKDVENRDWYTKFRGRFYVHAAKTCTVLDYNAAIWWGNEARASLDLPAMDIPPLKELERGGIIGSAELVDVSVNDCLSELSPWFMGKFGFVLRDPEAMEFIPLRGQLGFFRAPGVFNND